MSEEITLISAEGKKHTFPLSYVREKLTTVKNLLEDVGTNEVPLPNVSSFVLNKIFEFMNMELNTSEEKTDLYENFFKAMVDEELFSVMIAANYLEYPGLLDPACQYVAQQLRGKTPDEIRKRFGLEKDFSPEEEEEINKQTEWIREGEKV